MAIAKNPKWKLNSVELRALALCLMLLDHLWATVVPGNLWMTCLGRMAFPIFAFQTAEGYAHTSDFRQYLRRLVFFGLISEIPFNLMVGGSWLYPFHQNVMFTLALGLLALRALDRAKEETWLPRRGLWLLAVLGCCLAGAVIFTDYGFYGVLTVLLFGLSRDIPYGKVLQLAGMILIHGVAMEGMVLRPFGLTVPLQSLAVFGLIPIWLYSGEKGRRSKLVQYGSYIFYPLHMLFLGILPYIL